MERMRLGAILPSTMIEQFGQVGRVIAIVDHQKIDKISSRLEHHAYSFRYDPDESQWVTEDDLNPIAWPIDEPFVNRTDLWEDAIRVSLHRWEAPYNTGYLHDQLYTVATSRFFSISEVTKEQVDDQHSMKQKG